MPENHIHLEPPRMLVIAATGTLAILSLFLFAELVNAASSFGYPANPAQDTITVQGTGTADAAPDIAAIDFSVTETGSTVAEAQTSATAKTNDALAAMTALGIAKDDVKTTSYNVSPVYEHTPCQGVVCPAYVENSSTIVGYQVSESVDVKVRDLTKTGDVLQKLGDLGVENISGPNFTQDDDSATQDSARAAAIKDAQQRAQTLASELGVHLGKVVSFNENNGGVVYPVVYSAMASGAAKDAAAPELPTGTNETTDNVTITYAIR